MTDDAPETPTPLPATTTHQEDVTTAGQRRINLLWERTQSGIALLFVLAVVTVVLLGRPIPQELSNALFLIVGFYFSRTNHAAIGGVGRQPPTAEYRGR